MPSSITVIQYLDLFYSNNDPMGIWGIIKDKLVDRLLLVEYMACPDNIIEAFIDEIKFFIALANNNRNIMNQEMMLDHCSKMINDKISLLNNHCIKEIEQESFFYHNQYYLETRYPTPFEMEDYDSSNEGLLGISADTWCYF